MTGFIEEAAAAGMDVFRIFDALNDVDNMQVAVEAAQKSGRIVETSICYTGDVSDPRRKKFDLKYYVDLAKDTAAAARTCWRSRTWPACSSHARRRCWSRR